jgi:hypothetical protein
MTIACLERPFGKRRVNTLRFRGNARAVFGAMVYLYLYPVQTKALFHLMQP